jgi:hypothetical protein
MTWQGGKAVRPDAPSSPFAPLRPLEADGDEPAQGIEKLGRALRDYPTPLRVEVRLVSGGQDKATAYWEIVAGSGSVKAKREESKDADVIVVMRAETWQQIAQGALAPYDALYSGRLRVGGDFEAAKAMTRHLSDPSTPYVSPC